MFHVLCKITEKLVKDNLAGQIKKCGVTFSCSTLDFLTVVMAFNRSVASQAVALLYPKAFYKIWHASLFLQSRTLHNF